ncbi:MAG: glycine zipper family protein [Elusimicrobia bacterium]|nr:glycine zipper family protein [Elusimicrobiota bacterium]
MIEEKKELIPKENLAIEADEIIPAESSPKHFNPFEQERSKIYGFKQKTASFPLLPGLVGIMIGILLGALVGGVIGFLGGPAGIIFGLGMGALTGLVIGMGVGIISWILIPKFIRILISLGITFTILNWLVWKCFQISLWNELIRAFSK